MSMLLSVYLTSNGQLSYLLNIEHGASRSKDFGSGGNRGIPLPLFYVLFYSISVPSGRKYDKVD